MKVQGFITVLSIAAIAAGGCIRDEILPCPPLSVEVVVEDKNWDNIALAEAEGLAVAKDENLPFNEYVSTLTYELRNHDTGEIISSSASYSISHDGKSEILVFPEDLPFGKYELTLWGNLEPGTKAEGITHAVTLHTDGGGEADEIYHYSAVLDYDYDKASYTVGLQRTVGCLLVDAVNLPARINYSVKDIDGVMSTVSSGFEYSEPVSLHTELDWGDAVSGMRTFTCMGPSRTEAGTEVTVTFLDMDNVPDSGSAPYEVSADPVKVTLERNMLTVLRYDYDADGFHVSVLVNDRWETLHGMTVD